MNSNRRVVLVTGGSRGIGRATVIEFAKKGYDVVINYFKSEKEAIELKRKIEDSYSVKVLLVNADVSNEEEVKMMVDKTLSEFGHIDCLVNNAGIAIDTLFEDKTVDNFRRTLDVNLIGPFLVSRIVGQEMMKRKLGVIINVSSTNGIDTVYPESIDYDASKAGLISLTHNLALQYAPYIRVNSVAPGWVMTDMNKELDEEFINLECESILMKRFAESSEIAKVILFLASDEASYINNEVIRVDGGSK